MPNGIVSNKPFGGGMWVAVVTIDGAGTSSPAAAGTICEVQDINASLTAGSTSPSVTYDVTDAAGNHLYRGASGAGAGPSGAHFAGRKPKLSGLSATWVSENGATPAVSINISYRHVGGTAPTEV